MTFISIPPQTELRAAQTAAAEAGRQIPKQPFVPTALQLLQWCVFLERFSSAGLRDLRPAFDNQVLNQLFNSSVSGEPVPDYDFLPFSLKMQGELLIAAAKTNGSEPFQYLSPGLRTLGAKAPPVGQGTLGRAGSMLTLGGMDKSFPALTPEMAYLREKVPLFFAGRVKYVAPNGAEAEIGVGLPCWSKIRGAEEEEEVIEGNDGRDDGGSRHDVV